MKNFVSGFACGVIFTSAVFTWRVHAEFRKNHSDEMTRIYNNRDEELKRMREEACAHHEEELKCMREEHRIELRKKMDEALMEHKEELHRMREEECADLRKEIEAIRQM